MRPQLGVGNLPLGSLWWTGKTSGQGTREEFHEGSVGKRFWEMWGKEYNLQDRGVLTVGMINREGWKRWH